VPDVLLLHESGARLLFDGEVVEVLALEGTRATLRTDGMQTVGLTGLVSAARSVVEPVGEGIPTTPRGYPG
jgi:hypothetical protein